MIIAHERSGSTNMMSALSKIYKIRQYAEPFNIAWNNKLIVNFSKECVVKTIINQRTNDFYIDYVKNFDVVILLFRNNAKETIESLASMWKLNNYNRWHDAWRIDSNLIIPEIVFDSILKQQQQIKELSIRMELPITYYEDLYSGDINKFTKTLETIKLTHHIEELFPHFNPKNRLRQFGKKTLI